MLLAVDAAAEETDELGAAALLAAEDETAELPLETTELLLPVSLEVGWEPASELPAAARVV